MRVLSLLLLLLGAWAQEVPEAPFRRGILEALGLGGQEVRTLFFQDRLTYLDEAGQEEVLYATAYVDLSGCRLRLEYAPTREAPAEARLVVVFTPKVQYLLAGGRRVPLEEGLFLDLLAYWQTGLPGLLQPLDRVEALGVRSLPEGLQATAYQVERRVQACLPEGVLEARPFTGELYLSPEGLPLAEGYFSAALGARTLTLFGPYRQGEGVRYPSGARAYLLGERGWVLYARGENLAFRLNPELPLGLFP